jgi:hypothetical protein
VLTGRLDNEQNVSELEDMLIETPKPEKRRVKRMRRMEKNIQYLWGNYKREYQRERRNI